MILRLTISTKTQGEDPFNRHDKSRTLQIVTSMIQLDNFSYEQLIHKALHCNLYLENRSQLHLATQPKDCASPKTTFIAALVYPTHVEDQDYHKTEIIMCSKIATSNPLNQQQITICMKASSLHHCWFCSSFMNFLFSHFTHMFYFFQFWHVKSHFCVQFHSSPWVYYGSKLSHQTFLHPSPSH